MQAYRRNKLRTACDIVRRISNWPAAWGLRLFPRRQGIQRLLFRDGLALHCRGGTRDWDVIHELCFAGGYARALKWLSAQPGEPLVLDLGGNVGVFSLLAARAHSRARILAFEPGPPNAAMFQQNLYANASLSNRIELRREAVGGTTRAAKWFFDAANPAGSGLFQPRGEGVEVRIRAFAEILAELGAPVALVKTDIEGAEFEVLEHTPSGAWRQVRALSLELHADPAGRVDGEDLLRRLRSLGFSVEEESVCSFFLHREAAPR
jgi:FkbM family methyltransferase